MIDSDIFEGLAQGRESSLLGLIDKYEDILFYHILHVVRREEIAEEILQDVILTIVNKINFFKPTVSNSSFKSWILRIANNQSIDYIRKLKVADRHFYENTYQEVVEFPMEFKLIKEESILRLRDAILKLPALQRSALNLRVNNSMSYKEISQVMGISINSIKQGLFRAKANLQELLDEKE